MRSRTLSERTWRCPATALYKRSIYEAAVKRPSFQRDLVPIDRQEALVTVVTLTTKEDDPVDPQHPFRVTKGILKLDPRPGNKGVLLDDTWVSLPKESRPACRGARDPLMTSAIMRAMRGRVAGKAIESHLALLYAERLR